MNLKDLMNAKGLSPKCVLGLACQLSRPNTAPFWAGSGDPGCCHSLAIVSRRGQSCVFLAEVRIRMRCCSRISAWGEGTGKEPEGKVAMGCCGCRLVGRVRNSVFEYAVKGPSQTPNRHPAKDWKVNQKRPGRSLRLTLCRLWATAGEGLVGASDDPLNKVLKSLGCGQ